MRWKFFIAQYKKLKFRISELILRQNGRPDCLFDCFMIDTVQDLGTRDEYTFWVQNRMQNHNAAAEHEQDPETGKMTANKNWNEQGKGVEYNTGTVSRQST